MKSKATAQTNSRQIRLTAQRPCLGDYRRNTCSCCGSIAYFMSSSDVRDQMMRDMTPTMSSSEGAPSRNVDEMTYSGDVPMSPA